MKPTFIFYHSKNKIRPADGLEVGNNTLIRSQIWQVRNKTLFPYQPNSLEIKKVALYSSKYLCLPRYESTSSEDEEEEEEEDGSSSGESGEGECLDSTEEDDEAALEEETSEEERNINLDESDTDEETLRATNYSSDAVKEKYVVSVKWLM